MLTNTFCHIPGIGPKTERALWKAGVLSWEDVLHEELNGLSPRKANLLRHHASESLEALANEDANYFYNRLPSNQQWRMFGAFRHSVAYLDIETTGLGGPEDYITAIGIYDGQYLYSYVHGENLRDFADDVSGFKLLVTYNGKCFDLPFIHGYLGVDLSQSHIDLMFVLRALGYRGGLKGCEKQLGIERDELAGLDGYFAVLLWHEYHNYDDTAALKTLLAYNAADVINLETLMVLAYNMKLQETPFAETHRLAVPEPVQVPFKADIAVIRRIREKHGWGAPGV